MESTTAFVTAAAETPRATPLPGLAARKIRKKPILIAFSASVAVVMISAFLSLHAYIAWVLLNPKIAPLISNPKLAKGLDYINVSFPSLNQRTTLHGWYIPGGTDRTFILSHGYGANREETWVPMYDLAAWLHERQFNVLMFDYGFASTEHRQSVTGGKEESQQLLGAIEWAKQHGSNQVYIWGFSMGAGTALQAALHSTDIEAMILDSTFLLEPDTLYHNLKQHIDLPRYPSLPLVRSFFPILNGVSMNQIPYMEVKNTRYSIPILMIHGTEDTKAPYEIAQHIALQQGTFASDWWLVEGGIHEMIYRVHSEEYLGRVTEFLKWLTLPAELQQMIEAQNLIEI